MTASGRDPIVERAAIGPGHDGRAELVLTLRHPDGGHSTISLDEEAVAGLLARHPCPSLGDLDSLTGRQWPDLSTP